LQKELQQVLFSFWESLFFPILNVLKLEFFMKKEKGIEPLLSIADRLLGPEGCPWDRKQTLFTLQAHILEEVHELIEAIDSEESAHIKEEAADLLWEVVFVAKIAQQKKLFSFQELVDAASDKLIRRHPHIFGNKKAKNAEEVIEIWQEEKSKEKQRTSSLEGIPPSLPLLSKAQKMIQKAKRNAPALLPQEKGEVSSEKELGEMLFQMVVAAEKNGLNAEDALRREVKRFEKSFIEWEKKNIPETSS
jgi:tetrapyrrole methylase family protein / MazG family protein